MNKFLGHLKTVHTHRKAVRKLCFKLGLYKQGLLHDLSKYSPTEFFNGVKYYTGKCSPHVPERKDKGYSDAWMHHKGRNKHHAEYWQDIFPDGSTKPVEMPIEYFAEMFCDRVGASKIYLKNDYTQHSPLNYYETHKDENQFHPKTRERLEYCLRELDQAGEDEVFNQIKLWLEWNRITKKKVKKYGIPYRPAGY